MNLEASVLLALNRNPETYVLDYSGPSVKVTTRLAKSKAEFSLADYLKKHINRVHNSWKDHKCDSCGNCFSQPHHLKRHINTMNNGQKDHKCDLFGKAFSESDHLKRHHNNAAIQYIRVIKIWIMIRSFWSQNKHIPVIPL